MQTQKYDLEERLLEYSAMVVHFAEGLPKTRTGNHLAGQLLRAGTSPLFNHGEAQAAESADDFVHKFRICLKELRETQRILKLIAKIPLSKDPNPVAVLLKETDELIAILFASIQTAKKRKDR
jgi:four helix bundle protein